MRKTVLKQRKPLRQKTPLKKRTGLKTYKRLVSKKPLNKVGKKQKVKNALWDKVADERAREEGYICQWCHKIGQRTSPSLPRYLDGHHIIKRRYNIHTGGNCYVVHRFLCHSEIEDNNVDVRVCPDRDMWECVKRFRKTELVSGNKTELGMPICPVCRMVGGKHDEGCPNEGKF